MTSRRYRPAFAVAVVSAAPRGKRTGIRRRRRPVRRAAAEHAADEHGSSRRHPRDGARREQRAVADTAVMAVDAATGARFEAMTDAQGAYAFAALPVGTYTVTVVSAGLTAFRRQGVAVTADQNVQLDITLDAASAAQAADAERQELLQQVAELKQRVTDLESNTVLSDPETRVRRVEVFVDAERRRARRAGARLEAGRDLPARARLSPADDQREDRRGAGRRRRAQRRESASMRRSRRSSPSGRRATIRWSTTAPTRWPPPTCSSPPASPRTRSSSPTSSR